MSGAKILVHIAAWVAYICYEVSVALLMGSTGTFNDFAWYYLLYIAFFYFNASVALDYALKVSKDKAISVIIIVLIELAICVLLYIGITLLTDPRVNGDWSKISQDHFVQGFWRVFNFFVLSLGYWLALRMLKHSRQIVALELRQAEDGRRKAELETSLVKVKNAHLQAQINPHLLFNTLNFLYSSFQDLSKEAAKGVLLLSDVMRYGLQKTDEDGKVMLDEELRQVENYIALNQLRFNGRLNIQHSVEIPGEARGLRLPPLLLLTFIENMFKYAELLDPCRPALVSIRYEMDTLAFDISNFKKQQDETSSNKIGIQNAITRLNNLYRESDYELSILDEPRHYSLTLKLRLL